MTFGVVVFPGSNCDLDAIYVISKALRQDVATIWHQDADLPSVDAIILPGGFSYGDYLRPGAIASRSPIMKAVIDFAVRGGWILGICNGFQVLIEAGLLPGTLLRNQTTRFVSKPSALIVENNTTVFTSTFKRHQEILLSIAHKDGNYYADNLLLEELEKNHQIVLKYKDNPNGSIKNIAGICNKEGNVMGMMPHPERSFASWLGSTDGLSFFQSMLASWESGS